MELLKSIENVVVKIKPRNDLFDNLVGHVPRAEMFNEFDENGLRLLGKIFT